MVGEEQQDTARIDPRLPKIIYLRRNGKTLRDIGRECGLSHIGVSNILEKLPPNLLRACGLREKHAQKP